MDYGRVVSSAAMTLISLLIFEEMRRLLSRYKLHA